MSCLYSFSLIFSPTSSMRTWDSEEPAELELDHDKVKAFATKSLGLGCTESKRITRGGFHEIFLLRFRKPQHDAAVIRPSLVKADYTCIARFTREVASTGRDESEIATIQYLSRSTNLHLPEIYAMDLTPENGMGASCVLMERLPGKSLCKIWCDLSLEHKRNVISQVASMVVELSSVRFEKIGCIIADGEIGSLITPLDRQATAPLRTFLEYIKYFLDPEQASVEDLPEISREMVEILEKALDGDSHPMFGPSFAMIHADFDSQNMMFTLPKDGSAPQLSGLIDFELAHSGPLYQLYEFPIFIQDNDMQPDLFAENAVLRCHFVSEIFRRLPDPEARQIFIDIMNAKNHIFNSFLTHFTGRWDEPLQLYIGERYLKEAADGSGKAYGRYDYVPEYFGQDGRPMKHFDARFSRWPSRRAVVKFTTGYRRLRDAGFGLMQRLKSIIEPHCPRLM